MKHTQILNDKKIIDIYNTIKQDKILWGDHSLIHINAVLKNINTICDLFNVNDRKRELILIAGVLHDTGVLQGKNEHASRSFLFASEYLKECKTLLEEEKDIALNAIKNHSTISEDHNLETKILVLADKCDITKTRVTKAGKKQLGMREYQNINQVEIKTEDNFLKVILNVTKNFNKEEFNNFYFTDTLLRAIKSLAKNYDLSYKLEIKQN